MTTASEVTPRYAQVDCSSCGTVGLSQGQYLEQLKVAFRPWECPICEGPAEFDDADFNARQEALSPQFNRRNRSPR